MNTWWTGVSANKNATEWWLRLDGRGTAVFEHGKLSVSMFATDEGYYPALLGPFGPSPFSYANYGTLPTSPAALLRRLHVFPPNEDVSAPEAYIFQMVDAMLSDPALPPRLRAALFRVLPMLHGVTLQRDAVDAAGRHGVAFAMPEQGYLRDGIIIDPETYRYLGSYSVAVRYYRRQGDAGGIKPGTYLNWSAQLASGIVDRPGQRP